MAGLRDRMIFALVDLWVAFRHMRLWLDLEEKAEQLGAGRVSVARPRRGNERFFWRKVFDHDPRFTILSDKIAVRGWLARAGITVPQPKLLWTGTDAHDIPDALWRAGVVIKANHGSELNLFLRETPTDRAALIAQANAFLGVTHGREKYQWGYFGIRRQLLVEEIVFTPDTLIELKLWTLGPQVAEVLPIYHHGGERVATMWEPDGRGGWEVVPAGTLISDTWDERPLPPVTAEALLWAARIGQHFDHVRVDFLSDGQQLLLGELTLYNAAGQLHHRGLDSENQKSAGWDLRRTWFCQTPQKGWRGIYQRALLRDLNRLAAEVPALAAQPPLAPQSLALR